MKPISRRQFLHTSAAAAALASAGALPAAAKMPGSDMKLGLVTYLWAKDWDLDTIIKNCTASGVLGVELRTDHAHGVQPEISKAAREEVKKNLPIVPSSASDPVPIKNTMIRIPKFSRRTSKAPRISSSSATTSAPPA